MNKTATSPRRTGRMTLVLALSVFLVVILGVPWMFQDGVLRQLRAVPVSLECPPDVELVQLHELFLRQAPENEDGRLYLAQFTVAAKSLRRQPAADLRATIWLLGHNSSGDQLFAVRGKPSQVDLAPGATAKLFVRARDLQPSVVAQLHSMTLTATVSVD